MKELFRIEVKPEYREECEAIISEHTKWIRTEPGNIFSDAYVSLDEPCVFYRLVEFDSWESRKRHDDSKEDRAFVEKMKQRQVGRPQRLNWRDICP